MTPKLELVIQRLDKFMEGTTHANVKRDSPCSQTKTTNGDVNEFDKVDNHLATASLALLAATVGIVYKSHDWSDVLLIISIFAFFFSFLTFIWNQLRTSIRRKIYQRKHEKWIADSKFYLKKLLTLAAEVSILRAKVYIYKHADELEKLDANEIGERTKKFFKEPDKEYDYIVNAISHLMCNDAQKNYVTSFAEPLDEKNFKLKNFI